MSLGYVLVKMVLKIKGEKQSWSKDPIDYIKKRKQDIKMPTKSLLVGNLFSSKNMGQNTVTEITPNTNSSDYLLFYCHGGAFVYGPTNENWSAIASIVKATSTRAWMVDYPKAPESKIDTITKSVREAYNEAVKKYDPSKIILIVDSVGGNLLISLTQQLIQEKQEIPNRLILITPVLDASLTNPKIKEIDPIDPILSYNGVLSAKRMCAGDISLKDPMISPIYGSFKNFPPIHLFMATHDILMPDQKIFVKKVKDEGGDIELILGEKMPHIWPLLPVMNEAKKALNQINSIINTNIG